MLYGKKVYIWRVTYSLLGFSASGKRVEVKCDLFCNLVAGQAREYRCHVTYSLPEVSPIVPDFTISVFGSSCNSLSITFIQSCLVDAVKCKEKANEPE